MADDSQPRNTNPIKIATLLVLLLSHNDTGQHWIYYLKEIIKTVKLLSYKYIKVFVTLITNWGKNLHV